MVGQQVAWVSIDTRAPEDLPAYTRVDVVAAHIGGEGAEVKQCILGDKTLEPAKIRGFELASCMTTTFIHGSEDPSGVSTTLRSEGTRYGDKVTSLEIVSKGTHYGHGVDDEGVAWFEDTTEVLPHIKTTFGEIGLSDYSYSYLYFGLAHVMAHSYFEPKTLSNPLVFPVDRLLVDVGMHVRTRAELDAARAVADCLDSQIENDLLMQNNLTVFGDASAVDIPEVFAESRRANAVLESQATDAGISMIMGSASFIRIGDANGRARSWPYMDPSAADEGRAFGRELKALRAHNTAPANSEIARELEELHHRGAYARAATRALAALHFAEDRVIEARRA